MRRETLMVTWKLVTKKGYGRTPETYCTYIVKNKKRKHRLKTFLGTYLFELLNTTYVSRGGIASDEIQMDGIYREDNLLFVCNFRKTK